MVTKIVSTNNNSRKAVFRMEHMFRMKRKGLLILIVLFIVSISTGCQEKQQPLEYAGIQVKSYTVKQEAITGAEHFFGEFTSQDSVTISSSVPGRIKKAPTNNGVQVKKGQTIFTIENRDLQSAVSQGKSAVAVSGANLEKMKSGPATQEISAMEENVQAAKIGFESGSHNVERLAVLLEAGVISQQQFDQAQTETKVAESKYKALQHQLEQMKAGPTPATIKVGQAQFQQAQTSYQAASAKIKDLTIKSPLSGFVENLHAQEGEFINPGMPLATIHNIQKVYVQLYITEGTYIGLKEGKEVKVSVPSLEGSYSGKIVELDPYADPRTKLFSMKISVDNPKGLIKPGMSAEVMIPTASKPKAITVPLGAVINDKGESILYVIEGEAAKKKKIQTGARTAEKIEVVSGLKLEDQVIVDGVEFVRDGDLVQVQKEGSE